MNESLSRHIAWTSDHPIGLTVERADGPFLYLDDGRRIIDLISGIAVSSIGHRHPRVIEAIETQIQRYLHVMVYGEFVQDPQVRLAARLAATLPEELEVIYFTMTGTEANEGALKLAKKFTGRSKLIAFENSYHGDTHGSLSVTGRSVYRQPFEPLLPNVEFLPFNNPEALAAIDDQTACVITEPIQGEGGIRVPDREWLKALRKQCDQSGALLIFDEIQTGFGRTGSLFAFQHFDVIPDILTLAKAMGGGMPLGAFVSRSEVMDAFRRDPPFSHVTTFGGHPVSCAAADAALNVIQEEGLAERALQIEERLRKRLVHPAIAEIRGMGCLLGMDLQDAAFTERVVSRCLDGGVLLCWTLHSDSLVRIAPPLNIPFPVLEEATDVIVEALDFATT
ncbi:MAG: aspartate aminotransferase family protein [Rhodothermia bacterium]|nr:MAG: aspartate aminotransferase family protein [Rhodothermia bacterium]